MSIDNLVAWYEINVGQRLTLSFVNYLIKIGIINSDVDLDVLNGYLLEKNGYEYVIRLDNGNMVTVTQGTDILLNPGQRCYVSLGHPARVMPAY